MRKVDHKQTQADSQVSIKHSTINYKMHIPIRIQLITIYILDSIVATLTTGYCHIVCVATESIVGVGSGAL